MLILSGNVCNPHNQIIRITIKNHEDPHSVRQI